MPVAQESGAQDDAVAPVVLEPLQLTGFTTATFGTWVWAAALVATTLGHSWLAQRGHGDWPWICAGGVALGLIARRFAANRARKLGLPLN